MESSKHEKASKLTKILIKKIHGGRKQDSRFWQSKTGEIEQSHDNSRKNPAKILQIAALISGILVGCIVVTVKYGPDFVPDLYHSLISSIRSYLPERKSPIVIRPNSIPIEQPDIEESKERELSFTDEQVRRAMEEVLLKQKNEQFADARESQITDSQTSQEKISYEYEIELYSGGKIYTDNAKIDGDQIRYKGRNGLVVSIDKNEIKTMKRRKADD